MPNRKNNNEHRKNKHSFQAMLSSEQKERLERVKMLKGIEKNTDLLNTLLSEEIERLKKEGES